MWYNDWGQVNGIKNLLKRSELAPVKYYKHYPSINDFLQGVKTNTLANVFLFRKADRWSYEKEWRMVSYPIEDRIVKFPPEILHSVILGCQMLEEDKEKVKMWLKLGKISSKLFQAEKDKNTYSLKIYPL